MSGLDIRPHVYNAEGQPLWPDSPPYCGSGGVAETHPVCVLLYDYDAHLTYPDFINFALAVPADITGIALSDDLLAEFVMVLDIGGVIAVHGASQRHVNLAWHYLTRLAGGGRA